MNTPNRTLHFFPIQRQRLVVCNSREPIKRFPLTIANRQAYRTSPTLTIHARRRQFHRVRTAPDVIRQNRTNCRTLGSLSEDSRNYSDFPLQRIFNHPPLQRIFYHPDGLSNFFDLGWAWGIPSPEATPTVHHLGDLQIAISGTANNGRCTSKTNELQTRINRLWKTQRH